ncbi:hypothetical protein G6F68_014920 [Rhizopus microsporus]|nr:hypothetical protein G6F68_014920 [Rhizopus microsporus]
MPALSSTVNPFMRIKRWIFADELCEGRPGRPVQDRIQSRRPPLTGTTDATPAPDLPAAVPAGERDGPCRRLAPGLGSGAQGRPRHCWGIGPGCHADGSAAPAAGGRTLAGADRPRAGGAAADRTARGAGTPGRGSPGRITAAG